MQHTNVDSTSINILLTGATGFLGSHLLGKMLFDGYHVLAIKRSCSNVSRIKKWLDHPNLSLHDIDKLDPRSMFNKKQVHIIIHTATEYGRTDTDISKILETNLVLPIRLIELGIEYGVDCFFNTDTFSSKRDNGYPGLLNYALSKRALILWLEQLSTQIQVININLEHIYGPYDSNSKFVESLIRKIAIERLSRVALTPGRQRRDFIYIDDVVEAYMILIQFSRSNKLAFIEFDLGTGASSSIRDLAETIKKIAASNTVLGFGDISYRKSETMDSKAKIKPLMELGWAPKFSLKMGISSTLHAYGLKT
jgi:nucleoside-diphosphate-sugar epimerase